MAKIPRRFTGKVKDNEFVSHKVDTAVAPIDQQSDNATLLAASNTGRQVPPTPSSRGHSPGPPAYNGVGQAEALYEYTGTEENDLPFRVGDKITILEYVNNGLQIPQTLQRSETDSTDWWRGELRGKEGLFPSNYVKKTADTGKPLEKVPYEQAQQYPTLAPGQYNSQQYQPIQYASAPAASSQTAYAQPGAPQPLTVVQERKTGKLHSIGSKLGNAAIWGAGATSKFALMTRPFLTTEFSNKHSGR